MKNSSEKFILIQILRDKIFITIVSKHFKKLNFMICLFFKRKKLKLFSCCFNQFILQILNRALCTFYKSLLVLMLPYPEAINPRNIQDCLQYSLNGNMKLFLRDLAPITQISRPPIS